MQREEIAKLNLLLFQATEQGDKRAINIYKEATYEYNLIANALIDKLNFKDEEKILISYSGGVFKVGKYILEPLKEYIFRKNVKLVEPILQPVTGAALYSLKLDRQINNVTIINKLKKEEEIVFG